MLKSFKTEIKPTREQIAKINRTIGTCRYLYNFYLAHNKELYDKGEKFMSAKSFSVWLNNEYIPDNQDKSWIKEVSSKAAKRSLENANRAFKEFAVISNGVIKKNINKTAKLKKLEKKLKRNQRCLSRKYEDLKKRNNKMKGEATRQNIQKQVLKVQKLHHRIDNIRTDYVNKTIAEIVKTKPSYITIEDLNVKE